MDKMIVVVLDNQTQAYEATQALQELHNEGSIAVYSSVVIEKDPPLFSAKRFAMQAYDRRCVTTIASPSHFH